MKKLLLLLVWCVVAFSAGAQDYSNWYLKVPCSANGNDEYNGKQADGDGIATYSSLAIGTDGFRIQVWDGTSNTWYHTSEQIVPDTWTALTPQDSKPSSVMTIKGATSGETFTVKFNCATNQVMVTSQQSSKVVTYEIHGQLFGNSGWSTEKFTQNGDNWEWTGKLNPVGDKNFGVRKCENGNQVDWIGGNATVAETNKAYSFTSGSNSKISFSVNTNDDYTIVYNPTAQTINFKHGSTPVTTFKRFHLIGKFNEWNQNDYTYEFETEDGVTYTLTLGTEIPQQGNGLKVKEVNVNNWFGVDPNSPNAVFGKTIELNGDGNIKFSKNIPVGATITFTYNKDNENKSTLLVATDDVEEETPEAIYMHFKYDLEEFGRDGKSTVPMCQYYNTANSNVKSPEMTMTLESSRYSIWKAPLTEEDITKYNAVKFWFPKSSGNANYDSHKDTGNWVVDYFDSDNWTKYVYATTSRDHDGQGNYEFAVQSYLTYAKFKHLDQLDIDNGGRRNLYLVGCGKSDSNPFKYIDDSNVQHTMPGEVADALKLTHDGGCFYLTILPDGGSFKISWLSVKEAIDNLPGGYEKTDSKREWATFDLGLIGVDKDHVYPSDEYKPKYNRNDGVNGKVYFVRNRSVRYMNYNQADWVLPDNTDELPNVGRKRWLIVDTHCTYDADGNIDEANSCKTATITSFDPNPSVEVKVSGVQRREEPLADDVAEAIHHDCLYGAEANGHVYMKNVNYAVADVDINATNIADVRNSNFSRLYTLYVNNTAIGTHSGTNLEDLHIDYFPLSYDANSNTMSVRAKYSDDNTKLSFHSRTGKGSIEGSVTFKAPEQEVLIGRYVYEGKSEDGNEIYGVYVEGLDCRVTDNVYNVYSDFHFDRGSYADFVDENHYLYTASKGAFPAWGGWSNGQDWSSKLMADRELAPVFIHNVVRVADFDELKALDEKTITCTLYAVYPFMYNPNATFSVNAQTPASAPARRANEDFTGFKVFNTSVPTSFSFTVNANNAVSAVEGIEADVEADDAEAVYYTVSGVRVVGEPAPGIYVRVCGAKAEKVVVR